MFFLKKFISISLKWQGDAYSNDYLKIVKPNTHTERNLYLSFCKESLYLSFCKESNLKYSQRHSEISIEYDCTGDRD